MLSFLNSIVLPLLISAAIPLLIHFFNRRKVKTIQFSSLRFLKLLESQRIKHVRLYQILLILVRTLFILFLVLAFARPAVKSGLFGGSAVSSTTAVILLDDSYSMQTSSGNKNYFNKAQEYLQPILNSFKADDHIYILSPQPDSSQLQPLSLPVSSLQKQFHVKNYSPSFSPALIAAADIFNKHKNVNTELYFISDFRIPESCCKDFVKKNIFPEAVRTYFVQTGKNSSMQNVGIDTILIADQFPEINRPVTLKLYLYNYSDEQDAESVVHLFSGDKRVAMENAVIAASERKEVLLRYIPEGPGYQLLHAEIEDDDLLIDNTYYLNMHFSEKIKILAVGPAQNSVLQKALAALSSSTNIQTELTDYSAWQGKNFLSYDILLLSSPPAVNSETKRRLDAFLNSAKSLILVPGKSQSAEDFNRFCIQLQGINPAKNLISIKETGSFFTLSENFLQKPLFNTLFSSLSSKPEMPVFYKYLNINPAGEQIISFRDGSPFIQKYNLKNSTGSLIVFASALDKEWTDLPIKGLFVPVLYRLFFAAARGNNQQKSIAVSENFPLYINSLLQSRQYFIIPPEKDPYPIIPYNSPSGQYFNINSINVPGHYRIMEDDKIKDVFSVNVSSRELKKPFFDFKQLFPNAEKISDPKDLEERIINNRQGQELWLFFLTAALLMLIVEMLLIRRIESVKTKQPG